MRRAPIALVALTALTVAAVLLIGQGVGGPVAGHPGGGRRLASIFEDDQLLVDQPLTPAGDATVAATLGTLRRIGADEVRVLVNWRQVAPDPTAPRAPAGFRAADPAAYGSGWAAYDRLDIGAAAAHLRLIFDLSTPAPAWATTPQPAGTRTAARADADVYAPSAAAFGAFVTAAARRYSGQYSPPGARGHTLARVSAWSAGNEPNQPGWLSPQFPAAGVGSAAARYRALLDAYWRGLAAAGHAPGRDLILFGELAPNGCVPGQFCPFAALGPAYRATPPLTFLQQLYCVGSGPSGADVPLRGRSAIAAGCPAAPRPGGFRAAHPALFAASALAEHPYSFFLAPGVPYPLASEASFAPLASLPRLEHSLDAALAAQGSTRRMPIALTEYGYVTDPPNPRYPVSPAQQAAYLDAATYLAARDPRVAALGQFELQDADPAASCGCAPGNPRYWESFQEGLEYLGGRPKPALGAYATVIFLPGHELPARPVPAGAGIEVWGMLRAAPNGRPETASVQFQAAHASGWQTLARVRTDDPDGLLDTRVRLPGGGALRLAWVSPAGAQLVSRVVAVTVA